MQNHFLRTNNKVAPSSLKVVRGISIFGLEKISKAFLRLRNVIFSYFLHFPPGMKVIWVFKAKRVAFRGRNHAKVEKSTFSHSSVAKMPSRFFRFEEKFPGSDAKSEFEGTFCQASLFEHLIDFHFSTFSEILMGI